MYPDKNVLWLKYLKTRKSSSKFWFEHFQSKDWDNTPLSPVRLVSDQGSIR